MMLLQGAQSKKSTFLKVLIFIVSHLLKSKNGNETQKENAGCTRGTQINSARSS